MKMSHLIDKLLQDGNFRTISCLAPPSGIASESIQHSKHSVVSTQAMTMVHEAASSSTTFNQFVTAPIAFESRTSIIEDVMDALKGDHINPIVICGMGGIGKTTMLKEVFERAKSGGLFNEVAMAFFGRTLNSGRIQDEIADFLGLKFYEQSLAARKHRLFKRLTSNKKVLVILDDVWRGNDLEEVRIPLFSSNCRILMSSRIQDIYSDIPTKRKFTIKVLRAEEAWCLLKMMAGSTIESHELLPIAKEVLNKCASLPITILTIGRALHGKSKGIWNNALRQLRKPSQQNMPGMIRDVYSIIEFSYNSIQNEEAKSCFLLCCLYPEGSNIRMEDLVKHGLGLGLFSEIESICRRKKLRGSID